MSKLILRRPWPSRQLIGNYTTLGFILHTCVNVIYVFISERADQSHRGCVRYRLAWSGELAPPHRLNYNDLRHLVHSVAQHEEPTIVVRAHAVVVALAPLRAIVLADKMILVVPEGADALLYLLQTHMSGEWK